jgi:hypothetical protein
LKDLRSIILSDKFNIKTHFKLIIKTKADIKHSTDYTLQDLDYDTADVVACLAELTVEEYSESLLDRDDMDPPILYVFGKVINNKLVYIKVKIRESVENYIICVSFHYAQNDMPFPYK